jgi:hypothetical protein
VIGAALLHVTIRLAIRLLSFRKLQRGLDRFAACPNPRCRVAPDDEAKIVWATTAVARRLPARRNCLVDALVAHTLLRRRGHDASVRFGAALAPDRRLEAHAWVEREGRVILGASEAARFTPLRTDGDHRR